MGVEICIFERDIKKELTYDGVPEPGPEAPVIIEGCFFRPNPSSLDKNFNAAVLPTFLSLQ